MPVERKTEPVAISNGIVPGHDNHRLIWQTICPVGVGSDISGVIDESAKLRDCHRPTADPECAKVEAVLRRRDWRRWASVVV